MFYFSNELEEQSVFYWIVDKEGDNYAIGKCGGPAGQFDERQAIEMIESYCKENNRSLVLMAQIEPYLKFVNPVYPKVMNPEAQRVLDYIKGAVAEIYESAANEPKANRGVV